MHKTITNLAVLIVLPVTMIPILLGAADELEARRKEHYFWMRREHLRRLAQDRKRRHVRMQKTDIDRRQASVENSP